MLLVREKPRVGPKDVSDSRPHHGAEPGRPPEPITELELNADARPASAHLLRIAVVWRSENRARLGWMIDK
jgi:hypothetical protein